MRYFQEITYQEMAEQIDDNVLQNLL